MPVEHTSVLVRHRAAASRSILALIMWQELPLHLLYAVGPQTELCELGQPRRLCGPFSTGGVARGRFRSDFRTDSHGAFMEQSGRKQWQPVAKRQGPQTAQTSQNRCRRLPLVACTSIWLRRGSTVRVRQRALQKARKWPVSISKAVSRFSLTCPQELSPRQEAHPLSAWIEASAAAEYPLRGKDSVVGSTTSLQYARVRRAPSGFRR
jgi:hypothetical protein